jgi:hypothetical protein
VSFALYRLDSKVLAFQLKHGEAKVLLTDTEHSAVMEGALKILDQEGFPRSAHSTYRTTHMIACLP